MPPPKDVCVSVPPPVTMSPYMAESKGNELKGLGLRRLSGIMQLKPICPQSPRREAGRSESEDMLGRRGVSILS